MPSNLPKPTECRSCHAPIYWALTAAGRSIPVDADPVQVPRGGFVLLLEQGKLQARYRHAHEGERLYVAHFTTCPQRNEWRRAT